MRWVLGPRALVPTTRSQAKPPTITETLGALVSGTTREEGSLGLRTDIPPGTKLRRVDVQGRVATIALGGNFGQVSDRARIVAFAQLVFTATETPAVSHVRFELAGR